jgi:hypothetical protein
MHEFFWQVQPRGGEGSGLLVSCRILERAIECGMLYIFSNGSVACK